MRYLIIVFAFLFMNAPLFAQEQKLSKGLYALIETNKGKILLELFPDKAPLTVANFVGLAEGNFKPFDTIQHKEPFYDGLTFHRVISKAQGSPKDFMIQGGDPSGTGNGGPGYKFFDETDNGVAHEKGSLSMANAGPNTNGSQFFITHVATPHLNGKHTVFGKVLEGQDVVDKIVQNDTMLQVNIIKKGLRNKLFYNPSKVFKKEYAQQKLVAEQERIEQEKLAAQNKVRVIEAKAKSEEEYKPYLLELVKGLDDNVQQTSTGLCYVIEDKGDESKIPTKGDKVDLHYVGRFVYGNEFDSSRKRGQPLSFNYQEMSLIKGFDEGIGLIGEGGKITLYIPYFLAYGANGRPPQIPAYADLIFEIELLSVTKK